MPLLLDRLKNRKLVQWAVAYAAVAWIVMQLVEVLGERWSWPIGMQRGIDLVLVVGFLLTLVLAWYQGERGLRKVSGPELLIIAALLGIAGLLLSIMLPNSVTPGGGEAGRPSDSSVDTAPGSDVGRPQAFAARLELVIPDTAQLAFLGSAPLGIGRTALAISPDGRRIVYAALRQDGATHLCMRPLDEFTSHCLPGTGGAFAPFFSDDGRWIGFFSNNQLLKVPTAGGEPVILTEAPNAVGGSWLGRERIVWAGQDGTALFTVPADGGDAERVDVGESPTEQDLTNALTYRSRPIPVPGGDYVLYSNNRESFALSLSSGDMKLVMRGAESPSFVAPNTLIFARGSDLMAVEFSTETVETIGDPVLIEEGVRVESQGAAQVAVSQEGTAVFARGGDAAQGRLAWTDLAGRTEVLQFPANVFTKFRISPTGREVAAGILGITYDVWIYELDSGTSRRLTREGNNERPTWSSDGEFLYYNSDRDGANKVYSQRADGSGSATVVLEGFLSYAPEDVGPSGDLLSYDRIRSGDWDLVMHRVEGDKSSKPIWSEEGSTEFGGRFSPDGQWIAFTSDELGRYEVYIGRSDGSGRRFQISNGGGEEPVWAATGDRLFFRNGHQLLSVDLEFEDGGEVTWSPPRPMFAEEGWINIGGHSYDLHPDGQRLLIVLRDPGLSARGLRVIRDVRLLLSDDR